MVHLLLLCPQLLQMELLLVKHVDFMKCRRIEGPTPLLLLCPQLLLPQKSAKGPARSSHVVEQDRGAA